MTTIRNAIYKGAEILSRAGIPSPAMDVRILLQHALGCSLEELIKQSNHPLEQKVAQHFYELINRRSNLEPIAYITGEKEFYSTVFKVNDAVLIPREDSEVLIDAILMETDQQANIKILDIGTGSGCLIITLLKHLTNSEGWAIDISSAALEIAKQNASAILDEKRITFTQSDCFANLNEHQLDIIISNPPYICTSEKEYMSQETTFEPSIALFADNNGLAMYQKIAEVAAKYLKKNGKIYLEVGFTQSKRVEEIFKANNFVVEKTYQDIQNHTRCIKLKIANS